MSRVSRPAKQPCAVRAARATSATSAVRAAHDSATDGRRATSKSPRLGLDLVAAALEGPADSLISPAYLGPQDYPWLRALIDEAARFEGARRSDLSARLSEPLAVQAPRTQLAMARAVLEQIVADRPVCAVKPRKARQLVFEAAAGAAPGAAPGPADGAVPGPAPGTADGAALASGPEEPRRCRSTAAPRDSDKALDWRTAVLERVAADLGVDRSDLLESLFADLPGERTVQPLPADLGAPQLALRTNAALASALLARASSVHVSVYGSARAVVRHARRVGLLCVATPRPATEALGAARSAPLADDRRRSGTRDAVLHISGPLSLFRHTVIYGRALASLLPRLAWCDRFELTADVVLRGGEVRRLLIRSGDPLPAARELPRYDSRLEERFARDFARAAPDWNVVREPEPVAVSGGRLVFPDFELRHRHDPSRRWLLEIVGFWTPAYLEHKLSSLRQAELRHLVLCIDETRNCSDGELPERARVLRFRRRVDPQAVLAAIGGTGPDGSLPGTRTDTRLE